MLPVVHSFAAFLSARPMEQAVNAASERRRVAYVAGLAGLLPAGPGHSHQGVQDIAAFDRIGATVVAPSSERAVADAVAFLVDHPGNVYLRLCSVAADLPFQPVPLPPVGQGVVVHAARDRDTLLIAYGPVLLGEAVRAVDGDADLAARVEVVDLPWVNAVDPGWLRSASRGCRRVVVLDDHDARSGLGVRVAALMATSGIPLRVDVVGVEGLPECGAPAEVLAHHGLDAAAIAARLRAD
jgi:transketolase